MEQTVIRVGNSAGIILPLPIRQEMNLDIGDTLVIEKVNEHYILHPQKKVVAKEVNPQFAQMVHTFFDEHDDVLTALTNQ